MTISVDTSGLDALLKNLKATEFPTAMRNTINDLMRDVVGREKKEIERVFDRPTPIVRNGVRVQKLATKKDLKGAVWIKDVYGRHGDLLYNVLAPAIPGYPAEREQKGMERRLKYAGLITNKQYLVPSKTAKLNQYGFIPGSQQSKMLNDIGALSGVSGFSSKTKNQKVKYVWGTAKSRSGGNVTGVWLRSRFGRGAGAALVMVVVNKRPSYAKRFRFHDVGKSWSAKRMAYHANLAIEHTIRRRHG